MIEKDYLSIKALDVFYRNNKQTTQALEGINLLLPKGKIGVIIGPSGCGKSTLLNVITGLHTDYSGDVHIDGMLPNSKGEIALILQEYGLLPWKSVWDNIMLGLQIKKVPKKEASERIEQTLDQMGLLNLAKRYPAQLSGGQRQRIAIARSLVLKPKLLLMDEPFSSLDALTREEMQDLLLQIWRETNLTTLLITHNIEEAVFLGHEIFVMSPSPGTILKKISNPLAGDYESRGKVEFLKLANELRSLLHVHGRSKNEQAQY